jgi:peptidoglycan biosynthesis protein MviN/MurJ (putative lipid II flippase)
VRSLIFAMASIAERAATGAQLIVMAYLLGATRETDLYFVVTFVPIAVSNVLLDVCFVAVLRTLSLIGDRFERYRAAWHMLWAAAAFSAACALVLCVLAPAFVAVVAPGLDAESQARAAHLLRWASTLVVINGLGSILANVLLSDGRVLLGTARPPVNAGLSVALGLGLYSSGVHGIDAFVLGGVFAAAISTGGLLVLLLAQRDARAAFTIGFGSLRRHGFVSTAFSTGALNAVPQIQGLVERMIASFLPPGTLMLINLARTLYTLMVFMPSAISNARFSYLTSAGSGLQGAAKSEFCAGLIEMSLFGSLPVVLAIAVCARDIVGLLYGHGRVGPNDMDLLRTLAVAVSCGFPACIAANPVTRAFQIFGRNRELVLIRGLWTLCYAVLSYPLATLFGPLGLMLDDVIVANNLLLFTMYLRLARTEPLAAPNRDLAIITGVGLVAAAAGWLARAALPHDRPDLLAIAVGSATIIAVYWGLAHGLGLRAAREVLNLRSTRIA